MFFTTFLIPEEFFYMMAFQIRTLIAPFDQLFFAFCSTQLLGKREKITLGQVRAISWMIKISHLNCTRKFVVNAAECGGAEAQCR